MSTTFAHLGVPTSICDALARRDITEPFEIQAATIADGLASRDVCGHAPTGSGKTLAFGVPLVANTTRAEARRPTSLVLAPTRELAEQITGELRSFSGGVRVDAVYGGVGYGGQLSALRRGVDILVACPGRLEDLIQRGDVDLGEVRNVVLDEADRMADMGFMPAVRRLLDRTPSDRQTMLFSATLDGDIAKLTRDYQHDPVRHEVGEETPDIQSASHHFWSVERTERNPIVAEVVKLAWPSIIFCRTRHGADRLARQLGKLDLVAAPIHGGRSQSQRNRALDDFTKGRVHALVATDVAARGIHVDGVASVIHYDPPEDHKAYVHRSGRTARAGADGVVVSLVQREHQRDVRKMQRQIGLDEPFTDATTTDLPGAALTGERELAPARPPERGPQPRNGSRNRGPSRSQSGDRRGERRDERRRERHGDSARGDRSRGDSARGDQRTSGEHGPSNGNRKRSGQPQRGANGNQGGRPRDDGQRSGTSKPDNRKSRRAHLQPNTKLR